MKTWRFDDFVGFTRKSTGRDGKSCSCEFARAKKPRFSALTAAELSRHGIKMPECKEALHKYLVEKGHTNE